MSCAVTLSFAVLTALAQTPKLNWKVFPANGPATDGVKISTSGFTTSGGVTAIVPGTVFYSYVSAGKEADPDYAENIYKVDKDKYNKPFWYRTEFKTPVMAGGKHLWLNFNGINKRAEVFFNGTHIGTIKGLMERGVYDVTGLLKSNGSNAIAVLIVPPRNDPEHNHGLANWESPTYICSASWDWMPAVPGFNSGITDTVAITTTGPVHLQDPYIQSELPDHKTAKLTVKVIARNALPTLVSGVIKAVIMPGNIMVTKQITLAANAVQQIRLTPADFPQLIVKNPKLWWPNGYGGKADGTQYLYTGKLSFSIANVASDAVTTQFGIRKISADTTSLNGPMRLYINDVPVLVKGGNWGMSDYMLKARGKDYETRIRFHKDMNFNMIRNWTGEVTDEAFYRYCDKYGIMVWDDFWLNNMGGIDSVGIFKANAAEKIKKFRNHPSIVIWCGANEGVPGGNPDGDISRAIKTSIADNDDDTRLYLPRSNAGVTNPNFSIHGGSKNLSGSGVWANVGPKTYFTDPHNGYLFSKDSYGMRSELGTATFVNIESFKKFMPADYWVPPTPEAVNSKTNMWARHYFSTDGALGGGSDPARYIRDLNKGYGQAKTIEDFCKKAQLLNLETVKAMYEGWNDHMWHDASGMLMWMSQSAYPTMIWQTYDYYYDLTGAYFGAKTACEPVHIQWNAATNAVKVINNRAYELKGITAEAEVYDMDGKPVKAYELKKTINVNASEAAEVFKVFNGDIKQPLTDVHYLKLRLKDKAGKILSENFYWVGNTYLDYNAINKLPSVTKDLKVGKPVITSTSDKGNTVLTYSITNTSGKTAALAIRAQLVDNHGNQILPVLFSDGYFSLMQGESKILKAIVDPKLISKGYRLKLTPYNE